MAPSLSPAPATLASGSASNPLPGATLRIVRLSQLEAELSKLAFERGHFQQHLAGCRTAGQGAGSDRSYGIERGQRGGSQLGCYRRQFLGTHVAQRDAA